MVSTPVLVLSFHTKDTYGVRYTVNIFMFPKISLSAGSEVVMAAKRWDTTLDNIIMTTYTDMVSLLQGQCITTIYGWEAAVSVLGKWVVYLNNCYFNCTSILCINILNTAIL